MKPKHTKKSSPKDDVQKDIAPKKKASKHKAWKYVPPEENKSKSVAPKKKTARDKGGTKTVSKGKVARHKTPKDRVAKEILPTAKVPIEKGSYKAWRGKGPKVSVPKTVVFKDKKPKGKSNKPEVPIYFTIYKPFNTLCQFTKSIPEHHTLSDCYDFPPDIYPVGRLDRDSEGMLLLTNDNKLNHQLTDPEFGHWRYYYVQVEGIPTGKALSELTRGVRIRINKKNYLTKKAKIVLLDTAPELPERNPPIRFRKEIPTAWLSIGLTEGKNRQVRRMCAAVGFPVLRLVRYQIGNMKMEQQISGKAIKHSHKTIYQKLGVKR